MAQWVFSLDEKVKTAQNILSKYPAETYCFYGDLGAGKTTLIKSILQELGVTEAVTSPTFNLVNIYSGASGEEIAYHFDFYRIEDPTEALDIGWEDYLESGIKKFIEWPSKIEGLLPEERCEIHLGFVDSQTRSIEVRLIGKP